MRPPSSDIHELSVKKDPFFSKITDMWILSPKTPFSAIFGTLMHTTYCTKCRYRAENTLSPGRCIMTRWQCSCASYFPRGWKTES